jgi:hypothetical protein
MKKVDCFCYLLTKATADHKSPAQIIDEMAGKEIAAAAV